MGNEKLTVAEALKFARHDFLNELQLILLYMDLGKHPEARKTIMNATECMRQVSVLEKLGLPAVQIWLSTFDWTYSVFPKTLTCDIQSGIREVDDAEVVSYLQQVFSEAERAVDPASEYETQIDVHASQTSWSIQITVNGVMHNKLPAPKVTGDFMVEETFAHNQWTFTISGR